MQQTKDGNKIDMNENGITIEDKFGNSFHMGADGIKMKDKNGNVLDLTERGIDISDKHCNSAKMSSKGVTIIDKKDNGLNFFDNGVEIYDFAGNGMEIKGKGVKFQAGYLKFESEPLVKGISLFASLSLAWSGFDRHAHTIPTGGQTSTPVPPKPPFTISPSFALGGALGNVGLRKDPEDKKKSRDE